MYQIVIVILLLNPKISLQNLISCNQDVAKTHFCKITEEYPVYPWIIQPTIDIIEISEINDNDKTIMVHFNDTHFL